jgi:hypothetical protein
MPPPNALKRGLGQGVLIVKKVDDTGVADLLQKLPHKPILQGFRIQPYQDGSFDFAPDGPVAHCVLVLGLRGEMEDTVAWFPDDPDSWWVCRRIGVILGMAAVEDAEFLHEPLIIFETPADWVSAGRKGICIIDWAAHLAFHLPSNRPLLCQTERLSKKLIRALTPSTPNVEVYHA